MLHATPSRSADRAARIVPPAASINAPAIFSEYGVSSCASSKSSSVPDRRRVIHLRSCTSSRSSCEAGSGVTKSPAPQSPRPATGPHNLEFPRGKHVRAQVQIVVLVIDQFEWKHARHSPSQPSENRSAAQTSSIRRAPSLATRLPKCCCDMVTALCKFTTERCCMPSS